MRDIICPSLKEPLDKTEGLDVGPRGFGDLWEALVIIFRDLGNNFLVSPAESKTELKKNLTLKEKPIFHLTF